VVEALPVFGQSSATAKPGKSAFDNPALGKDDEALAVRKVKEGETTNDLFGFLTTEPNAEIRAIHPKAMPVF
jgi:hypothetical protein